MNDSAGVAFGGRTYGEALKEERRHLPVSEILGSWASLVLHPHVLGLQN